MYRSAFVIALLGVSGAWLLSHSLAAVTQESDADGDGLSDYAYWGRSVYRRESCSAFHR
jgi:hypothetical protein